MTERKPPGVSFESWIDRQIRIAQERGEFDDLPGAGKPIPGAGKPDDPMWWVNQLIEREQISVLPPALKLRREVDDVMEQVHSEPTEDAVRRVIGELNARIVGAVRRPPEGPPVNLVPLDVEKVVRSWRERRES